MANEFTNNENRARLKDSLNRPTPCDGYGSAPARSHNDLPPPIRGDAPMTKAPDRARLVNPAPVTEVAAGNIGPYAKPGMGLSPDVLATMDAKIPPAYAARIRDQARKK